MKTCHTVLRYCATALLLPLSMAAQDNPQPPVMDATAHRQAVEGARKRLQNAWREFGERNARGEMAPDIFSLRVQPKILTTGEMEGLMKQAQAATFPEPDVVRSVNGKLNVTLNVFKARNQIGSDPVYLRSYNGKLVGPTLRCRPGDTLYITVSNNLDPEPGMADVMNTLHGFNTTNLHTHGLHVSPSGISDNVLLEIPPRSEQKYEIVIPKDHPAGTFWYHAHKHGSTAANVGSGMSGALIIEGGLDTVPEIARVPDRVMVLQQIPYVNNASKPVCPAISKDTNLTVGVIEAEYADCSFGPRTWDKLGRYTTINGVKLPVIRMQPGSVERWRLIDSAIREVIQPELVRVDHSGQSAPSKLNFHEIAVDGLALGRVATRSKLELWPGYRSDVLIQAPPVSGVQYVLRDARVPGGGVIIPEERRYLAVVIVEGPPNPMPLPTDEAVKRFRLPSIDPKRVTARQSAAYGIIPKGDGVVFTIDRQPLDFDEARQNTLGEVQEWTVISRNNVGPVSHPFHIHVNPFEIFSILDEQSVEQLDRDPKTGAVLPVWRDTIILNEGWKVSFRTEYTDFDGVFVQHCHILDHEDEGMMELVEISKPPAPMPMADAGAMEHKRLGSPYPAPAWSLPDAAGKVHKSADLLTRPTVLFFYEGFACLRCNEQMTALVEKAEAFRKQGVQVIGISTDTVADLGKALDGTPCPFPLLADPEKRVFRSYGCYADGPLHGLFVLDATGRVHWQNVSMTPYMDVDALLREVGQVAAPARSGAVASRQP
jgi:FtsP/CotA-like multicopper oxidase with cupredoxin domain/peroxiredoxin